MLLGHGALGQSALSEASSSTTAAELSANMSGAASFTASLTTAIALSMSVSASFTLTSVLDSAARFEMEVTGSATMSASLSTVVRFEIVFEGVATLQASLIAGALMTSTGAVLVPEVWDDFQAAGGTRLGWLPYALSYLEKLQLDGNESLTMRYALDTPQAPLLVVGNVVRTVFTDGTWTEWRIDKVIRESNGVALEITGSSVRRELLHALISQTDADGFVYFDVPAVQLTPATILSSLILANAPAWLVAGTVTPTAKLDMNFGGDTAASGLARLEAATGYEAEIIPSGTTQYHVNLVRRGSTATALRLRTGRNLISLREEVGSERMTVVAGFGAANTTIAFAYWQISAISGAGPYLVTLISIHGGTGPIGEDDQLNNLYVEDDTTGRILVTDSIFSTQQIQVSSLGSMAVGDWVRFVADSAGKHLTTLDATAAKASVGTLLGAHESGWDDTTNILKNGIPSSWPGTFPDNWSVSGSGWLKKTAANEYLFAGQSLYKSGITPSTPIVLSRNWQVSARENVYSASVWIRPTNVTDGGGLGIKFTALGQTMYYLSPINSWVLLKIEAVTVAAGFTALLAELSADTPSNWTGYIAGFQINKGPIAKPMTLGSNPARIWQGMNAALASHAVPHVVYSGSLVDFEAAGMVGEQIVVGQTVEATTDSLGNFSARMVAAVLDRQNPNNSKVTLSTMPPLASKEISGPPDLDVPFFEPIDLQASRRDRVITAMLIKATITASSETQVTIELDVRDSLGLTPMITYADFGASWVSGSGVGPYVFNRPALGDGVGRVVFTAQLQGRTDVSDAVDVPERSATGTISVKAEVQSSSATQMVVRVSAAAGVAGTGTVNYTTNVTVTPSGGGTVTLMSDINNTPTAGQYIDYTITRSLFGTGAGRVQFNVIATGMIGGSASVDVESVPDLVSATKIVHLDMAAFKEVGEYFSSIDDNTGAGGALQSAAGTVQITEERRMAIDMIPEGATITQVKADLWGYGPISGVETAMLWLMKTSSFTVVGSRMGGTGNGAWVTVTQTLSEVVTANTRYFLQLVFANDSSGAGGSNPADRRIRNLSISYTSPGLQATR